MAYNGYLIKVGDYEIPARKYIKAESYKASRKILDLDNYVDADGHEHRNALEHTPNKVEFETPAMLTNLQMAELFGNISKNYTIAKERRAVITLYVPELDEYIEQDMYMPDPEFSIYSVADGVIKYNPVGIAFIGY